MTKKVVLSALLLIVKFRNNLCEIRSQQIAYFALMHCIDFSL